MILPESKNRTQVIIYLSSALVKDAQDLNLSLKGPKAG